MRTPRPTRTLQHVLRSWAGNHPLLFERLVRLRGAKQHLLVRPETDVVIEGFPRSGNTFAVAAFRVAQQRDIVVARHLHVPSQIKRAAQWGIPAVVLLRDPRDAVVSLTIREPHVSLRQGLLDYLGFYRGIADLGDHYVVGAFEETIASFGTIVQRLNRRFGTEFIPFVHTPEGEKSVFGLIEIMDREDTGHGRVSEATVARPSSDRAELKVALLHDLETSYPGLLQQALDIYQEFLACAARTPGRETA